MYSEFKYPIRFLILVLTFLSCAVKLFAQVDTLIVYDVRTKKLSYAIPRSKTSVREFDFTSWNTGAYPGLISLPQIPPSDTQANSGFTELQPAQNLFDISSYPVRTAVKVFRFAHGSKGQVCSGTLVASHIVLTAAHCLFYDFNDDGNMTFGDSMLVAPAYDRGRNHPIFKYSMSRKYYLPKRWYDRGKFSLDDIALIELNEQPGLVTGWVGIAYHDSADYFKGRVFHNFNYPGVVSPFDSTKVFNGDTLYYNYGTLDVITEYFLGYNQWGIPGQSGGSMLYTDNNDYYTFGVQVFSHESRHYRIREGHFYAFKNVIEQRITPPEDNKDSIPTRFSFSVFPNPFYGRAKIEIKLVESKQVSVKIYNILGQRVADIFNGKLTGGTHQITYNMNNIAGGIYYMRLRLDNSVHSVKITLLK